MPESAKFKKNRRQGRHYHRLDNRGILQITSLGLAMMIAFAVEGGTSGVSIAITLIH